MKEYTLSCNNCHEDYSVNWQKFSRVKYRAKKFNSKCFCSLDCKNAFFGKKSAQTIICGECGKSAKKQYSDTVDMKYGNFCSRSCFHSFYSKAKSEEAHESGHGKIYDVVTKNILTGTNKEIGDRIGVDPSNISNIRHKKHDSTQDRYCLLERKEELIFQLKNVETGEIYDLLTPKTIFIYLNIAPTENEKKYIYELKTGRQEYASLGTFLISTLHPTRNCIALAKNSHIMKEELLLKRLQRKIVNRLRSRVASAIREKGSIKSDRTINLVGCSVEFFMGYIEAQFVDGMSWDNYGVGIGKWQIDHIIPCNTFDMEKIEDQKKCFHYINSRPLWCQENASRPKDGSDISVERKMEIITEISNKLNLN